MKRLHSLAKRAACAAASGWRLRPRPRLRFLAALLLSPLAATVDAGSLLDHFYERQIEEKALAVWRRQAAPVDYEKCRAVPGSCLGRVVFWSVSNSSASYAANGSEPISWANKAQVPGAWGTSFEAVARVVAVRPHEIELLFIGSSEPGMGETTWTRKFGARLQPKRS